eukprot:jgi/Mesvir1/22426/Mv25713-RA.1
MGRDTRQLTCLLDRPVYITMDTTVTLLNITISTYLSWSHFSYSNVTT